MKRLKLLCFLIAVQQLSFINCQSLASTLKEVDICAGARHSINCDTTVNEQSIIFTDAFYGIQNPSLPRCGYSPGDCGEQLTLTHCGYKNGSCIVGASNSRKINKCNNKIANYFNIKYYCVPYSYPNNMNTVDICSGTDDITQANGFITSPQYPSFSQQNKTCIRKIKLPPGKSINIWAVDTSLVPRGSSGACENSYIKIKDNTGTYDLCGQERKSFTSTFCSNQLYISYLAADTPTNFDFRGFKLYYETYDASTQVGCTTATPAYPETTSAVSTTMGTIPGLASPVYSLRICLGQAAVKITAPSNTVIYVESFMYGIPSSLTCEDDYSSSHCLDEAPISCNLKTICTFSLRNVTVPDCGSQTAQYLYLTYRFIPTQSANIISMCVTNTTNVDVDQFGIIQSRNFPKWEKLLDCKLNLVSNNQYKAFKLYITEITIDQANSAQSCISESVTLSDGVSSINQYCGITQATGTYSYTSCSNNLTIGYRTSAGSLLSFFLRGFKAYYELIDRPASCSSSGLPTTPKPVTSATKPTVSPTTDIASYVLSTDPNGVTQQCLFPFIYKDQKYSSCINLDRSDFWCSLTYDYDADKKFGICNLGFSSNVQLEVCSKTIRKLSCPNGYLFYPISAEYSVTNDGSCDYSQKKCAESAPEVSYYLIGKNAVSYFASPQVLTSCSNAASNLVHIDYTCIPDKVEALPKFEFCLNSQGTVNNVFTADQGIIQTPNYPTFQSSLDCTLQYQANENKLISVYAVYINLEIVASNKECQDYYLQVNDEKILCGTKTTVLIHQSCSNSFKVKIKSSTRSYKGAKLYYEAVPITSSTVCPQTEMPTSSLAPVSSTTVPIIQPDWVIKGIASPTQIKNLCLVSSGISCPANYSIVIRETMFGFSPAKDCFFTQGDCVSYETIDNLDCAGRQSCTIPYKIRQLPECGNKFSNYLRVKYDCVPDFYQKNSMCSYNSFTQTKGAISSPNYPVFAQNINCETNINVNRLSLIKVYIKDLSLDSNCSVESLTLTTSQLEPQIYCGEIRSIFAMETCTNNLKLNFQTKNEIGDKRGFSIYYEEIPKPSGFVCPDLATTTQAQATTKPLSTTKLTTTPNRPPYYGFASPLMSIVGCTASKISCEPDHIIIVESSVYGVHKSNISYCSTEIDDCQAAYASPLQTCSGYQSCPISFTSLATIAECNKRKADYFEIIYRCVPTLDAGKPLQRATEVCSAITETFTVSSTSSALFQSPGYPTYPKTPINCKFNITTTPGDFLNVYVITARFASPTAAANCSIAKDYLRITDGVTSHSYCNNANHAKYLMQSRSNWVMIELATNPSGIFYYKGAQIFVQGYKNQVTSQPGPTTTPKPIIPTPVKEGLATAIYHDEICSRSSKIISCPKDYVILIHEEALVDTNGNGCGHGDKECYQPTDLLLTECSNRQNCSLYFPETEITRCYAKYADLLHYEFQCIPNIPPKGSKPFTACLDKEIQSTMNGIITSPQYPKYTGGLSSNDCTLKVAPPVNNGIKFFITDLGLSSSLSKATCDDYLLINDVQFCGGSYAQLGFVSTDSNPITIKYNSLSIDQATQQAQQQALRGFKIYFETYDLKEIPATTAEIKATTVPNSVRVLVGESTDLFIYSLAVGIPICAILAIAIIVLLRLNRGSSTLTNIKYSKDKPDLQSFSNPILDNLYDNSDLSRSEN